MTSVAPVYTRLREGFLGQGTRGHARAVEAIGSDAKDDDIPDGARSSQQGHRAFRVRAEALRSFL